MYPYTYTLYLYTYALYPYTHVHLQRLEERRSDMGEKGHTMFDKANNTVDSLTDKSMYINTLAEQKRSKLEQNVQYMHFEKEARQVRNI